MNGVLEAYAQVFEEHTKHTSQLGDNEKNNPLGSPGPCAAPCTPEISDIRQMVDQARSTSARV